MGIKKIGISDSIWKCNKVTDWIEGKHPVNGKAYTNRSFIIENLSTGEIVIWNQQSHRTETIPRFQVEQHFTHLSLILQNNGKKIPSYIHSANPEKGKGVRVLTQDETDKLLNQTSLPL